jgi:hypothetical protein
LRRASSQPKPALAEIEPIDDGERDEYSLLFETHDGRTFERYLHHGQPRPDVIDHAGVTFRCVGRRGHTFIYQELIDGASPY